MNALSIDAVNISSDRRHLVIIDQTLLPNEIRCLELDDSAAIYEAIKKLRVRGAPAIGVAAAYGIYILMQKHSSDDKESFRIAFERNKDYLSSSRPTAVNLQWALNRMERVMEENIQSLSIEELILRLGIEADEIRNEDIRLSRSIGNHGFSLLRHGNGILTHCNAGTLAASKYGTALAPVYIALEQGWKDIKVYCDETRPLLQGARLSAFEMMSAGVDTTLLCDNMASYAMKKGLIDIVFVGADRIAANGDFANKTGTSGVAILARHYGIPFYCLAPSTTIDASLATGESIPIEERDGEEVTTMWYLKRMAPEGINVLNPAFDVTDNSLITGIITEKGIANPPFFESFKRMGLI